MVNLSVVCEEDKVPELILFVEGYKRKRCLDCGATSIDSEHSADHTITTEIRIPFSAWQKFKIEFLLAKLPKGFKDTSTYKLVQDVLKALEDCEK
jgi:hypothetical protein